MSGWNPNYGDKKVFKKKNHYDLRSNTITFRIIPQPKGKNADYSNTWSKFHSVVFGYKNMEGLMNLKKMDKVCLKPYWFGKKP